MIIDLLNSIKGNSKDDQVIIDKENRHYQLVYLGNDSLDRYFFHVRIHLHLRTDGIICVYENRTEEELSDYLMEHGVLKSEILAAFLPQHVRQYAGYAVA